MFLQLVSDQEAGVAFVRPMTDASVDLPRTIRSMPLTFVDTVLVLFLRERLLQGSGARVFVGRDEIDDHCAAFRAADDTNLALFGKRVNASVSKLKDASILRSTSEGDRYEVSPVLDLVFDADNVHAVAAELRRLAGEPADESRSESLTAQQQLERIQLVNWGTFNGSFTLPVPPRDGLLITGPSGSGKSSLLDALAAVLVQPSG